MIVKTTMRAALERAVKSSDPCARVVRRIGGALRSARGTRHVDRFWRVNRGHSGARH